MEVTDNKLPTYQQILVCFLSYVQLLRRNDNYRHKILIWKAVNEVKNKLIIHYVKANITCISVINISSLFVKFYQEYCTVKKSQSTIKNARSSPSPREAKFNLKLGKTMPFSTKIAEKILADKK